MKRRLLGVFLCLIAAWVFLGDPLLARYRARPPERVDDLPSFLRWRPDATDFRTMSVKGNEHLLAFDQARGLAPSGPPAYVFDPWGNLVDWTADSGDDVRFRGRWVEGHSPGKQLDRQAAAKWPLGSDAGEQPAAEPGPSDGPR